MTDNKSIDARARYIDAFHATMIDIWRERVALLKVIDTGNLYRSVMVTDILKDSKVTAVNMKFAFRQYGIYQNYGTGRETPRGNPGDIGRAKVRRPRPWFQPKYIASVLNLRDFFAESLSLQFISVVSDTLTKK